MLCIHLSSILSEESGYYAGICIYSNICISISIEQVETCVNAAVISITDLFEQCKGKSKRGRGRDCMDACRYINEF